MNGESIILGDRAQALANYPHARKVGDFLYVSGISSRRPDNTYDGVTQLADGTYKLDVKAQTKAVIENIRVILQKAGGDLGNIVDVTIFLVNMEDYQAFNEVYNQYFTAENGPSRTCVAVKQLPGKHLLIEIKAVAYLR
ncbi:hypothetical protein K7432_003398 [Basidiobolus ranarum]|uniref:2-aminomuconate deaminase n=1 Tax=Basidiobolus ranarum TaxID=34480 RepID=A0ABR2W681_9FUNG